MKKVVIKKDTVKENIKKYYKPALVILAAFALGFALCCLCCSSSRIATIDVARIAASSSALAKLNQKQQQDMAELQKWIKEAQADVKKQKSKQQRDELTKKYDEELMQKQQTLQQEYSATLKAIDTEISSLIEKKAKSKGYGVVLAKDSVVTGGKDITDDILELMK